uniref:hypothetical protein n=1 Tax=Wolbachia endosymbiont of Carposina sasakii TaxID=2591635 RepID=UPI001FEADD92|nr:hypothetical protein [Wolbachia endosymbiont of Carposina sasakii]
MSLISLGYIFTYYFLLISSYSLSHFFSRQALKDHYFHTGYVEENVEVNFEPFFSSQPATVSELTDFDRGVLKVCGDWGAHPDKEDFKILLSCPQHQEVVKGIYK